MGVSGDVTQRKLVQDPFAGLKVALEFPAAVTP
jgi:hypothetical protein